MCWKVRLWVEQLERIGEKGGWAEQCATEGGTDEVRGKWREKKTRKGKEHTRTETGSFPFIKTEPQKGNNIYT